MSHLKIVLKCDLINEDISICIFMCQEIYYFILYNKIYLQLKYASKIMIYLKKNFKKISRSYYPKEGN